MTTQSGTLRGGNQPLQSFASLLGLPGGFVQRQREYTDGYSQAIGFLEHERPKAQNHWPALTLALIAQAEDLLARERLSRVSDIIEQYPPEASQAGKVVNTFNLPTSSGVVKLRPYYNRAMDAIRVEMRRSHPSNAAHATQSWPAYSQFVDTIFACTPGERAAVADWIWQNGVLTAEERKFATAASRVIRPFEYLLLHFETHGHTPGGALYQAITFGYFRADSPNLTLESHSVNTGSSHADMIGDVAGFRGGEVELAIEVKDYKVDDDSVEQVLGDFLEDLVSAPNATAVVVAGEVTDKARERLNMSNVIALSRSQLTERVATWDLPKQQEAIRGCFYYLSRIQKSPKLAGVLSDFMGTHGITLDETEVVKSTTGVK